LPISQRIGDHGERPSWRGAVELFSRYEDVPTQPDVA
jgi:hypothetical protein